MQTHTHTQHHNTYKLNQQLALVWREKSSRITAGAAAANKTIHSRVYVV